MDAVYFWKSIKELNVPIVITLHGYDINTYKEWWESGKFGKSNINYPKRLLKISQHPNVTFIAVSHFIMQRAVEFGIPKEKIKLHYIGVDIDKFSANTAFSDKPPVVLFVGRFVEKKAPLVLIKAFAEVVKQVPNAKLVMVGDGSLKEKAEQLVETLALPVEFRGVLTHDEIIQEFEQAKVFCLPSIRAKNGDAEGLPISILEAISKNLLIVITKHSGNLDLVDINSYGKFVEENDINGLSQALIMMLEKENKQHILTLDKFLERFSLRQCNMKLEKIYKEVCNVQ